jgi:hypothetical protein
LQGKETAQEAVPYGAMQEFSDETQFQKWNEKPSEAESKQLNARGICEWSEEGLASESDLPKPFESCEVLQ